MQMKWRDAMLLGIGAWFGSGMIAAMPTQWAHPYIDAGFYWASVLNPF